MGEGLIEDSRRMNKPAHSVIKEFALRKCLVAAFVSDNPEARHPQTSKECVESPNSELPELIEVGARELDEFRANARVEKVGCFVCGGDEGNVHRAVQKCVVKQLDNE